VHPTGKFAYISNFETGGASVYSIDAATGALTFSSASQSTPPDAQCVTVDPDGRFAYIAHTAGISAFTINPITGELTDAGRSENRDIAWSVAVDPSGRFVYAANPLGCAVHGQTGCIGGESSQFPGTVSMYSINPATGALTAVDTPVTAGMYPRSVTVDPSGKFAYTANWNSNDISIFSIDLSTGALTAVGTPVAAGIQPIYITTTRTIE
jgi:6-phosphogluconolactonase (cycloisomerase 2 family)